MRTIEVTRTDKRGRKQKKRIIVESKQEMGRWAKKKTEPAKNAEK